MKQIFFLFSIAFLFSSCIEIIDDISIKADGSGTFKYNVNLSASKVKINSYLALDSLDGKKVPTRAEILSKVNYFKTKLEEKEGISEVEVETDMENFIVKLSCHFTSVQKLQDAITLCVKEEMKDKKTLFDENYSWISWTGEIITRSIPDLSIKKTKELKEDEIEQLKQGNYISITRVSRPIKALSNEKAVLAKNKVAAMLKVDAYSLTQNPKLLENTIYLSPLKP